MGSGVAGAEDQAVRPSDMESPFPPHPVEPLRWWERVIVGLLIVVSMAISAFLVCAVVSGWAS